MNRTDETLFRVPSSVCISPDMTRYLLTRTGMLALAVVALACSDSPTTPRTELLVRYVALGNSITAGFQSGGISDATQRASFATLLASQAGVAYDYASMGTGCPSPLTSLSELLSVGAGDVCAVLGQTPGRKLLNNVAVPGANSFDPTSTDATDDLLEALILDGKSQVQKALEETPSFITVWIGNNDVLASAVDGVLDATPQVLFAENYGRMVDQLVAGGVQDGVLIGVVDVTKIPLLVPAPALADPSLRLILNFVTGETVTFAANCTGSTALISVAIVPAIAQGLHSPSIDCVKGTGSNPVGERFIVDAAEQTALTAAVAGYNAYISAKAAEEGLTYFDPNPLFAEARTNGEIPTVPDVSSPTPFGLLFSLDGVHPSSQAHVRIANALIDLINSEYGTSMRRLPE